MTKEQLIDKLQEIWDNLDDAGSMVEDIPVTPLEDIDEVINGKKHLYSYTTTKEKKGCLGLIDDSCSVLEDIINELKESV